MPRRKSNAFQGKLAGALDSEDPPVDDFGGPVNGPGNSETVFWPWGSLDPMEKLVLETVTNVDYDRLRTPSPKLSGRLVSPPKVERRPGHDQHRHYFSSYSNDFDIPAEEAQSIRENSRENGSILFEHFNQKFVPQENSPPRNSPAIRNARQILDSPFKDAPLGLPGDQMSQSGDQLHPQDSTQSQDKTAAAPGWIRTKATDSHVPLAIPE